MKELAFAVLLIFHLIICKTTNGQVSGSINLNNRRVLPPRVLPTNLQTQQQQQQRQHRPQTLPRQRPPFNRFAPNPAYFNTAYLTDRVNRLEDEIGLIARGMNGVTNTIRMTVNTMLTDQLSRVREEIQNQKVIVDDNQEKVDQVSQEMNYIKNSNANMQKRMDRIEETQREQGETIENIHILLNSIQNAQRGGNDENRNASIIFSTNNNDFDKLSSSVASLAERMNDSDLTLASYNERIQTFSNNILALSEKANSLQRDSLSTARWLSSIRGQVSQVEQQVRRLQVQNDSNPSSKSDVTILNLLQSSINDLNHTILSIAKNQRQQSIMLQNLTLTAGDQLQNTSENNKRSENSNNFSDSSEAVFEMASSLINLEDSFQQLRENYEISTAEALIRMKKLDQDVKVNKVKVKNLQQQFSTKWPIQNRVNNLNMTLQNFIRLSRESSETIVSPSESFTKQTNQDFNGTNHDFVFLQNISASQSNIVTSDILENRLKSLLNNLTLDKTLRKSEEGSNHAGRAESLDLRADSVALNELQTNVDILNTTVAVQGTMLRQAIGALGNYDRRLLRNEKEEKVKSDENNLIRELLENATQSLSRMSLSVAEHDLILPSIYESLTTGDEILLDLSQQIYEHEFSLDSLNKTLFSMLDRQRRKDQSQPNAYSQAAQSAEVIQRNQVETLPIEHYVSQEEFSSLAATVTEITGKLKETNKRQRELRSILNALESNLTSNLASSQIDEYLKDLWIEANSTRSVVHLLENVVASLSSSSFESNRQITTLQQAINLLQSNSTDGTGAGLHSEEFIRLLDTSVRELRVEVNEQRNSVSNQRRRIRQLEDEQLHSFVKTTDLTLLNRTLKMEINAIKNIIKTLRSEMLLNVAQRPDVSGNLSASESFSSSRDQTSLEIIQRKLNQVMSLVTGSVFENDTINNRLELFEELKTVPLTLRILEGQVQDFQDSIQGFTQLEMKVSALNSLRNLVFQNSGDITTFHQSVADLEVEVADVKRKSTVIEFSNQRLQSYQDDLRSRLNQTKLTLDRTNGENAIQAQQIRILSRFLDGNSTELKGRIDENELNLNEKSQQLQSLQSEVNNLKRDVGQQESADLMRHTELNSRLSRGEKRIETLEEVSEENGQSLTTATRSISEERNARVSTLQSHESDIQSIRQLVLTVERASSENKLSSNQNSRKLHTILEKQTQNSNEISNLKSSHRSTNNQVQEVLQDLQTMNEEKNSMMNDINTVGRDLNGLRDSFNSQSTNLMSIRQQLVVMNDDINSLQQTSQRNSLFANRAEQAIDRHNTDISFILEHSSNHSVAIQRLKHRIRNPVQDSSNATHGLLSELSLMEQNVRGLSEELVAVKRNLGIREAAALRLEEQCRESANEAKTSERNIRDNSDVIRRLQSDVYRYSERLRGLESSAQEHTVARNDLQQTRLKTAEAFMHRASDYPDQLLETPSNCYPIVVLSNREELSLLSNIPNDLNQISRQFTTFATRQENRTQAFERSLQDAKFQLSSTTKQVSNHDETFRTLRQDRISLAADIDRILRSSSNLEQLLRATVTDLAQLKRDFDSESDFKSIVPRLQRSTATNEANYQLLQQTVSSNENKISRIQDLVDRATNTVSSIMTTTQNRLSHEQSREQSRSKDVRDLRESISRSSVLLRSLQNDIHAHNERLHLHNQRIIELDRRVSKSSYADNENHGPVENDLEASGWLFPSTAVTDSNESTVTELNSNFDPSDFTQLSQRVDDLSKTFANFTEEITVKFSEFVYGVDQKLNESFYEDSDYEFENLVETTLFSNRSQEIIRKNEDKGSEGSSGMDSSNWPNVLSSHLQDQHTETDNENKEHTKTPILSLSRLLLALSEEFERIDVSSLLDYTLTYETEDNDVITKDSTNSEENSIQSSNGVFHNVSVTLRKISRVLDNFDNNQKTDLLQTNLTKSARNKISSAESRFTLTNLTHEDESIFNSTVFLTVERFFQSDDFETKIIHFLTNWKNMSDLLKDISTLKNLFSDSKSSLQSQLRNIVSLQNMQSTQSRRLSILRNNSRTLETRLDLFEDIFHAEVTDLEKRLEIRYDNSKQDMLLEQLQMSNQLLNLQRRFDQTNSSLTSFTNSLFKLHKDLESSIKQNLSSFQELFDLYSDAIETIQVEKAQINQKIETIEEHQSFSRDRYQIIEDDLINLNYDVEWSINRTNSLIRDEETRSAEGRMQIKQSISSMDLNINSLKTNFSTITRKQNELILQLQLFDRFLTNQTSEFDLTSDVDRLRGRQSTQELSLNSHSMQLRGLSQRIQAFEDMIGTMSDTIVLHGDKILLLSEAVLSSSNKKWKVAANNISEILSNYSVQFENIQNQISILSAIANQQPSVRVIIPGSRQDDDFEPEPKTDETSVESAIVYVPPPLSVAVQSIGGNQLNVSWVSPLDSRIQNYRLTIENAADSYDTFQITATRSPVIVNNVRPSNRYLISVQSVYNQDLSTPTTVYVNTDSVQPTTISTTELSQTTTSQPVPTLNTTLDPNSIYTYLLAPSIEDIPSQNIFFKCDFDNVTLCGFVNDDTDDFDWTHWNGSTPSSETGPSMDHTQRIDGGFYMFIEASRPRRSRDVARLLSPLFQPTDGQCLRFYYHMYGVGIGDLSVLLVSNDRSSSTRIWLESGNSGNQWKSAKVTIVSNLSFKLAFEGMTGIDYHSDIAIDDVTIQNGACPEPLLQCSFETPNICGFIQDYDDDFDWDRSKGTTSSADTGPTADHTMGTASGYYLFLEASNPRIPNDTTRLSSPMLSATNGECLQFYYHMHGVDIGSLNVYLRHQSNSRELGDPIWSKHGPQGDVWLLSRIFVTSPSSFQVVFEGVRGENYHGDIALDDVSVTDGICKQPVCALGERFENFCYEVQKNEISFQEAKDLCLSKGGLLASIKSNSQQTFISNLLSIEDNSQKTFWLGLTDEETEGIFMHSDGTELSGGGFTAWDTGEPVNVLGTEDCVSLEHTSTNRMWNVVPCNRRQSFICQYPASM